MAFYYWFIFTQENDFWTGVFLDSTFLNLKDFFGYLTFGNLFSYDKIYTYFSN